MLQFTEDDEQLLETWITVPPPADSGQREAVETAVRGMFPAARGLSSDSVHAVVSDAMSRMSPDEAEDFWQTLAGIGSAALPIVAPIVGTAIGGPAGTAIGGIVGQLGGQILGGLASQPSAATSAQPQPPVITAPPPAPSYSPPPPPAPSYSPPAPPAPSYSRPPGSSYSPLRTTPGGNSYASPSAPPPSGTGQSPAAAQLLSLLQNPVLLQAILGQLLPALAGVGTPGAAPNGSAAVGSSFGGLMNAVSVLANQAAAESEAWNPPGALPAYLAGAESWVDPTVPEQRAEAVLQQLRESRTQGVRPAAASTDPVASWFANAGLIAS